MSPAKLYSLGVSYITEKPIGLSNCRENYAIVDVDPSTGWLLIDRNKLNRNKGKRKRLRWKVLTPDYKLCFLFSNKNSALNCLNADKVVRNNGQVILKVLTQLALA